MSLCRLRAFALTVLGNWTPKGTNSSSGPAIQEVVGSQKRSQAPRTAKATPKKLVRIEEEGDDSDKEDSPDEIEDDSDFEA